MNEVLVKLDPDQACYQEQDGTLRQSESEEI